MPSQIRYRFKILDEWWVKKLPEKFLGGHKVSFAVQFAMKLPIAGGRTGEQL